MTDRDWLQWHAYYDDPGSGLAQRLAAVQGQIHQLLAELPPGPARVVSVCAGQGRDLLEVLATHPRQADVSARLVELDPRNVETARRAVVAAGLTGVEVVVGDAASPEQYAGAVPADLVLVCGVLGNISTEDVARTVRFCTQLTRTGGHVIWTRHRRPPDLVPVICRWFEEHGFTQRWLSEPAAGVGVGVHRFDGRPAPLAVGDQIFAFDPA